MTKDKPGAPGPEDSGRATESTGWAMLSYMIGGMALYGLIGWLAGGWLHVPVLFPIGMIVGIALGVATVIFRVTRS